MVFGPGIDEQLTRSLDIRNPTRFVAACVVATAIATDCLGDLQESNAVSARAPNGIHYIVQGDGEPVVFVHGFSQTHEAWLDTPLFRSLAGEYMTVAVDLRGHGDSDKPHDPKSYGRNMEADLVDLLDHLDIDRAHFIGFSMGASVVGGLVVTNPERVQTAVLGSGFFTRWHEEEEEFAILTEARGQSDERYPWEPDNQDFAALAAVIRGARYATVTDEDIANIRTPTLIVFGSAELELMAEEQRIQLGGLPDSVRLLVVGGADHDSQDAAILSIEFTETAGDLIASNPTR